MSPNFRLTSGFNVKLFTAVGESVTSRIDRGMLDPQGQLERGWLKCCEFGGGHERTSLGW
jgi:hypothetical protein